MNAARVVESQHFRDLLIVLVLLIVADGLISQFLAVTGLGLETNPFLQVFVGGSRFLPLKLAGGLLVGMIMLDFYRRRPTVASASTAFFVIVYTAILYWNIGVVFFATGRGI